MSDSQTRTAHEWPTVGPNRDPAGRAWALALLNPLEFDEGESGDWIAGTVFEVIFDVLTYVEVNPGRVARMRIHNAETGALTHKLSIGGPGR